MRLFPRDPRALIHHKLFDYSDDNFDDNDELLNLDDGWDPAKSVESYNNSVWLDKLFENREKL